MSRSPTTFYVLLFLACLFAFVIPPRFTNSVRDNLRFAFYPLAWPANRAINFLCGAVSPNHEHDDQSRDAEAIIRENKALKVQIANLTGQMARLQQLEAQRQTVGDVRSLCKPSRVISSGADASQRQTLMIAAGSHEGIVDRMPVLFGGVGGGGIAGRIAPGRVQITGSVVQLITDRGFAVGVRFARITSRDGGGVNGGVDFTLLKTPQVLAEGDGKGSMWIRNLAWKDATDAGLKKDDWVILQDEDWPDALQRYRLGKIESIARRPNGPGFAEIRVVPPTDLLNLREVLVLTAN